MTTLHRTPTPVTRAMCDDDGSDVENDRSVSNSGRSTPVRAHRARKERAHGDGAHGARRNPLENETTNAATTSRVAREVRRGRARDLGRGARDDVRAFGGGRDGAGADGRGDFRSRSLRAVSFPSRLTRDAGTRGRDGDRAPIDATAV